MPVNSSAVELSSPIFMFFDRNGTKDQAIFRIGDKSLEENDQASIFVNSFVP